MITIASMKSGDKNYESRKTYLVQSASNGYDVLRLTGVKGCANILKLPGDQGWRVVTFSLGQPQNLTFQDVEEAWKVLADFTGELMLENDRCKREICVVPWSPEYGPEKTLQVTIKFKRTVCHETQA